MQAQPPRASKYSRRPTGSEPTYPSFLCASLVADNPVAFMQSVTAAKCSALQAVNFLLQRHGLLRHLYQAAVLWIVHSTQSSALGRKQVRPSCQTFGINQNALCLCCVWQGTD